MNNLIEPHPLRIVLRLGASVFGLSAIFLLLLPELFLNLLALPTGADQVWSMRMIAITLVALTGNMLVVSLYASSDLQHRRWRIRRFNRTALAQR